MYNKKYYEKNKEKFKDWSQNYRKSNPEKVKSYNSKYFQENKEDIYKKQKEWRKNNKEKWLNSIAASRTRRVERLRAEGVTNPWGVVIRGSKPKYKKEV